MNRIFLARSSFVLALAALAVVAQAGDRVVKVQPIFVAKSYGTGRTTDVSFPTFADKIYDQAGIDIQFMTPFNPNDTNYYNFNYNSANALVSASGKGQSSDPLVVNCFFSNTATNASEYGFGYLNSPYMVLDVSAIKGYFALGRVDTFSHELGHVLNLDHYDEMAPGNVDPSRAKHLMAGGGVRLIPRR